MHQEAVPDDETDDQTSVEAADEIAAEAEDAEAEDDVAEDVAAEADEVEDSDVVVIAIEAESVEEAEEIAEEVVAELVHQEAVPDDETDDQTYVEAAEEPALAEAEPHEVVAAAEEIAAAAVDTVDAGDTGDGPAADSGETEAEPVPVVVATLEPLTAEDVVDDAEATFVAVEDAEDGALEEIDGVVVAEVAPLRPGDVAQTTIAIWKPDAAAEFREHLREVSALFVDEPVAAVSQAQSLVADAVRALAEALLAEQLDLDPRQHTDNPDTEALRVALRRYRDFLERVLAL